MEYAPAYQTSDRSGDVPCSRSTLWGQPHFDLHVQQATVAPSSSQVLGDHHTPATSTPSLSVPRREDLGDNRAQPTTATDPPPVDSEMHPADDTPPRKSLYKDRSWLCDAIGIAPGDRESMTHVRQWVATMCRKLGNPLVRHYTAWKPAEMRKLANTVAERWNVTSGTNHFLTGEVVDALIHRICLDTMRSTKAKKRRRKKAEKSLIYTKKGGVLAATIVHDSEDEGLDDDPTAATPPPPPPPPPRQTSIPAPAPPSKLTSAISEEWSSGTPAATGPIHWMPHPVAEKRLEEGCLGFSSASYSAEVVPVTATQRVGSLVPVLRQPEGALSSTQPAQVTVAAPDSSDAVSINGTGQVTAAAPDTTDAVSFNRAGQVTSPDTTDEVSFNRGDQVTATDTTDAVSFNRAGQVTAPNTTDAVSFKRAGQVTVAAPDTTDSVSFNRGGQVTVAAPDTTDAVSFNRGGQVTVAAPDSSDAVSINRTGQVTAPAPDTTDPVSFNRAGQVTAPAPDTTDAVSFNRTGEIRAIIHSGGSGPRIEFMIPRQRSLASFAGTAADAQFPGAAGYRFHRDGGGTWSAVSHTPERESVEGYNGERGSHNAHSKRVRE
ncbi:hypothetical protein FN846DRAFT_999184 [Sphaerosporella brunnea]|uniref:Uncharacterized protein n=1 Tax=Sphaerosporella brunnea TaxID=1250544 RepID=A0A5J5EHL5_9PEZI|nr:hypothetical protein FN846DRAFT_999184 [Sphaerosporella brunnea]